MHAGKHGYGVGQGAADDAWREDIDSGSPYIQAVVGYQTERVKTLWKRTRRGCPFLFRQDDTRTMIIEIDEKWRCLSEVPSAIGICGVIRVV